MFGWKIVRGNLLVGVLQFVILVLTSFQNYGICRVFHALCFCVIVYLCIFDESACLHIVYVDAVSCLHIVYVDATTCLHIVQVICCLVIT